MEAGKLEVILILIGVVLIWWCMGSITQEIGEINASMFRAPVINSGGGMMMNNTETTRRVFILAGQSNMAGRGGVEKGKWDGLVPGECEPNRAVSRLSTGLVWEEAREPLHHDIDANKTCGIGPGLVFAKRVWREGVDNSKGIGLVPCAAGGTSIREWGRGSRLYNNLIARTKAAVKNGGILEGILWYQGERDTIYGEDAYAYRVKLEQLFLDFRCDLQSPHLPIVEVLLASAQGPWMEEVREAQLDINLPNVIKVDAKGLPLQPDGLHLSTKAQVRLGEMMADAFLEFKPKM